MRNNNCGKAEGFLVYIPADARMRECRLGSSTSVKDTLPVVVTDATLALAIFDLDFRVSSRLNSLHSVGDQAIRSNFEMVIMLNRKSLRAEIGFSNTILSFNRPVIGCSSFFLPTLFKAFRSSLSSKISWFTPGHNDGGPITGGLLSTSSMPRFPSLINVSACRLVLPTVATMFSFRFPGVKM